MSHPCAVTARIFSFGHLVNRTGQPHVAHNTRRRVGHGHNHAPPQRPPSRLIRSRVSCAFSARIPLAHAIVPLICLQPECGANDSSRASGRQPCSRDSESRIRRKHNLIFVVRCPIKTRVARCLYDFAPAVGLDRVNGDCQLRHAEKAACRCTIWCIGRPHPAGNPKICFAQPRRPIVCNEQGAADHAKDRVRIEFACPACEQRPCR